MFSVSDAALDALLAKIDTHMEATADQDVASSPAPHLPNYLRSTLAHTVPTNPEFIEAQRIRDTFRSHTCWALRHLPDHIRPNAVKDEMTAHAMKNQLGTMFTDGPDGVGIPTFKVSTIKSKTLFNPIVYQPNDFDKPSDLRKAMLEEERNINASFSKRPFKTSESVKVVEAVPHDFGVDKRKKQRKGRKAPVGGGGEDEDEDEDELDLDIFFDVKKEDIVANVDFETQKRQVRCISLRQPWGPTVHPPPPPTHHPPPTTPHPPTSPRPSSLPPPGCRGACG